MPAPIRLLIVADGYRYLDQPYGLDFSSGPMGLSRFVSVLLATSGPARFDIALAHLDDREGAAMLTADRRIRRRMPRFAFDDPSQFRADRFDVVFLFGCIEQLSRDDAAGRRRMDARGEPYPLDRLSDTEIAAIGAFQHGGGGLFAAGDCGNSGRLLGHHLPRVGHSRKGSEPAQSETDFPAALDGGPRPLPIPVRAGPPGTTGLYAYDGHRAGIGRTISAPTWRPFLNASLAEFDRPSAASADPAPLGAAARGIDARCCALAHWLARPVAAGRRRHGARSPEP